MKKVLFSLIFFLLVLSCKNENNQKVIVDFNDEIAPTSKYESDSNKPIYIAIASMTSPRETFTYYSQLIKYLSDKLGKTILIKQKKTYDEVNELLKNGEVDFAFICSGAYVGLSQKKDVNLLVAPVINDKIYYQAYIISKKNPDINSFVDLKDKSFAFTDPLSNTGYTYPSKLLKELETNKGLFFSKTIYTYGHDISIHMVNRGVIDGASVHGLIFDFIAETHPESVNNIKIIKKSEWFAMPPVVTPKHLDSKNFKKYQDLFMNIHRDSIGKSILEKLKIERFVTMKDTIYNNVRKLKNYVEN